MTIIMDATGSTLTSDFPTQLKDAIFAASLANGTLSIIAVDGEAAPAHWVLSRVALNDPTIGDGVKRHTRIAAIAPACAELHARQATPTHPGTDLATALRLASAATTGTGTVWVQSDGLSSVGALDLDTLRVGASPAEAVGPALAAVGELPDWSGRTVVFAGLGATRGPALSQKVVTWLEDAYLGLCASAGADSCSIAEGVTAGTERTADLPEDAPVAVPLTETATVRGDACVFILSGVYFTPDSSDLTSGALDELGGIAAEMVASPGSTALIVGHTAGAGDPDDPLAVERASAVQDSLIAGGVAGARLDAFGVGSSQPVGTPEQNRRVELQVRGLGSCT
ncbi:OmpA family protein [Cryobacterium zongtaii]|nr:OmpA family protein [Cryobacterium zongtaii]